MRIQASLLLVTLGLIVAVGCHDSRRPINSGTNVNPPYFGPGSAPNTSSFAGQGGLGGGVGQFAAVSPMTMGRAGHTANLLPSGNVVVIGGWGDPNAPLQFHIESEVYDVAADTWTVVSTLTGTPNQGRLMDPTDTFPTGRTQHQTTTLIGGSVIVTGGLGYQQLQGNIPILEALNTVYSWDEASNTFTRTVPMPTPRYFHMASLLSDGTVLVTSGFDKYQIPNPPATIALQSADIFSAGSGAWTPVGGAPGGVATTAGHTLGNQIQFKQDILVINGARFDNTFAGMNPPPAVQIYVGGPPTNPIVPGVFFPGAPGSTGSFSSGGELYNVISASFGNGPAPLRQPPPSGVALGGAVTLQISGDVFFAGGENFGNPQQPARFQGALPQTELLSASTNAFTAGPLIGSSAPVVAPATPPPPPFPVTEVECAEISTSGDVLIVPGSTAQGTVTPICEVWNNTNNVMIGQPMLGTARRDHVVLTLPGNASRILVIGGSDDSMPPAALNSVELYTR